VIRQFNGVAYHILKLVYTRPSPISG